MSGLIDTDTALKVAGAAASTIADSLAQAVGAAANATWQGLTLAYGIASDWLIEYARTLEAESQRYSTAIDEGWDEEL